MFPYSAILKLLERYVAAVETQVIEDARKNKRDTDLLLRVEAIAETLLLNLNAGEQ